jgi:pyrroline-5-carboxylate reductase
MVIFGEIKQITMRILIVGGGNMGLTFAKSFLRGSIVEAGDLHILEKRQDKVAELEAMDICQVHADAGLWVEDVDIIILAVKPQDTAPVYDLLQGKLSPQQVVLSIMAGVTMAALQSALHTDRILRAMPNLPAQVGVGMTVYTATDQVSRPQLVAVTNLLNTTGKTIYVESEQMIDAATAISGSGPAYVFYMIEALTTSAVDLGFSRAQAELLATQTFAGAQALLRASSATCQEWIEKVSSRGGTTEAAIASMQDLHVAQDFAKGVQAAYQRAIALGKLKA